MKTSGALRALLAILILSSGLAVLAATAPPTQLRNVGDHWTAWDPPDAGPNDYIIVRGDTLWDLAGDWFGDPFLWPQIWDENRYILDSHWIYPGDPLVVPGMPTVVPESGDLPVPVTQVDPVPALPEPSPLRPAADPADVYCAGRITKDLREPDLMIVGHEFERVTLGQGDVIFLSQGRNAGVRPGDELSIIRNEGKVQHPQTERSLGYYERRLGKVRVLLVHETTSTAVVEMSCEDVYANDRLVPWEDIPVPMLESLPEFVNLSFGPPSGTTGHVLAGSDPIRTFGAGHVIFTDLGHVSGVRPGDALTLFRDRDGLPRMILAQAIVLTVDADTSTAKIMESARETVVGDRVEALR